MQRKLIFIVCGLAIVLMAVAVVVAADIGQKIFKYPQPVAFDTEDYVSAAATGRKTASCTGTIQRWIEVSDTHSTTVEEYCTLAVTYDISDYDSVDVWYGVSNWDDIGDTVLVYAYIGSDVIDSMYPVTIGTADPGDTMTAGADALGDTMIYATFGTGLGHWLEEITVYYILIDTTAAATEFHLYGGAYAWDVRRAPTLLYPTKIETYSDHVKQNISILRWDYWSDGAFNWWVASDTGGGAAVENYDTFKYSYDVAGFDTVLLFYGVKTGLVAPGDTVLVAAWAGSTLFDSLQAVHIGIAADAGDTLVKGTDTLIAKELVAAAIPQWQDVLELWFIVVDTSTAQSKWHLETAAWGW